MMDQFREEVVTKQNKTFQTAAYILANVMWILLAVYTFLALQNFSFALAQSGFNTATLVALLQVLLPGALAVFIFLKRDQVRTEYEYTFTNGQMDFAQVFNNKKRKNLGTMNLRNLEACGLVSSGSFQRYITMPGIKRTHWFLNREAQLVYLYFQKDGQKRIIIIEPSEEMTHMIQRSLSQGVWQVN